MQTATFPSLCKFRRKKEERKKGNMSLLCPVTILRILRVRGLRSNNSQWIHFHEDLYIAGRQRMQIRSEKHVDQFS